MLALIIVVGIAFLLQGFFSFLQMRHLSNEFIRLRRKGKVAFGRKSGGFRAGAVVMFRIDDDGIIQEGRMLSGLTAFAKVRPLPHLPQVHQRRSDRRAADSLGEGRRRRHKPPAQTRITPFCRALCGLHPPVRRVRSI